MVESLEGRALLSTSPADTPAAPTFGVSTLTLINAKTDKDVSPLVAGTKIDLSVLGSQLSVRANTFGTVASVKFVLDGKAIKIEGAKPYSIASDNGGNDYYAWTPAAGNHVLAVTAYAGANATGVAGGTTSVAFTVTSGAASPPPAVPVFPTKVARTTVAANPLPRTEAIGTVVNGKLYVTGGYYGAAPGTTDKWVAQVRTDVYDPATNKWTRLADIPEKLTHASGTVVGDVIWYVGGYVGNHPGPATTHVWKFDTKANVWSRGPDLPEARGAGGSALIGNTLYFVGGMEKTRTVSKADMWALNLDNPSAGWVKKASAPTARNHVGVAAVGGKLYLVGGQLGQEESAVAMSNVEAYDPVTNTWAKKASLPNPRGHITAATFVYQGRIVTVGGESRYNTPSTELYAYDPATDKWSVMGYLPAARSTMVAGVLPDGRIVASTGNNPTWTTTTWIGKPA